MKIVKELPLLREFLFDTDNTERRTKVNPFFGVKYQILDSFLINFNLSFYLTADLFLNLIYFSFLSTICIEV